MAQSQSIKHSNRIFLSVVGAFLAICGLALVAFSPDMVKLVQAGRVSVSEPLVTSSLNRLSTSNLASERLAAANWIGTHVTQPSSNELATLQNALQNDSDPTVRASTATALQKIALNQQKKAGEINATRNVEPQLLEILETAYSKEKNGSVRRVIVEAVAKLSYPHASYFLKRAETDPDPAVRDAALKARSDRDLSLPVSQGIKFLK
jgi:hypothetical protein